MAATECLSKYRQDNQIKWYGHGKKSVKFFNFD